MGASAPNWNGTSTEGMVLDTGSGKSVDGNISRKRRKTCGNPAETELDADRITREAREYAEASQRKQNLPTVSTRSD